MKVFIEGSYRSNISEVISTSSCDWFFETDWEFGFEEWDENNPSSSIACTRFVIFSDRSVQAIFSINRQWFLCQGESLKILMIETAIHEVCHLSANLQKTDNGLPLSKIHRGAGHCRIWKEHMANFGLKGGKRHLGLDWIKTNLPENTLEIIRKSYEIFG